MFHCSGVSLTGVGLRDRETASCIRCSPRLCEVSLLLTRQQLPVLWMWWWYSQGTTIRYFMKLQESVPKHTKMNLYFGPDKVDCKTLARSKLLCSSSATIKVRNSWFLKRPISCLGHCIYMYMPVSIMPKVLTSVPWESCQVLRDSI